MGVRVEKVLLRAAIALVLTVLLAAVLHVLLFEFDIPVWPFTSIESSKLSG